MQKRAKPCKTGGFNTTSCQATSPQTQAKHTRRHQTKHQDQAKLWLWGPLLPANPYQTQLWLWGVLLPETWGVPVGVWCKGPFWIKSSLGYGGPCPLQPGVCLWVCAAKAPVGQAVLWLWGGYPLQPEMCLWLCGAKAHLGQAKSGYYHHCYYYYHYCHRTHTRQGQDTQKQTTTTTTSQIQHRQPQAQLEKQNWKGQTPSHFTGLKKLLATC